MEAEAKSTDYNADNQDGSVNESGYVEDVAEQNQELESFQLLMVILKARLSM